VTRKRIFKSSHVLYYSNAKFRCVKVGLLLICFIGISFSLVLHHKVNVMSDVDCQLSSVYANNTMSVAEKYVCCTLQVVR
jgi:hypothetical protein